jgi:hypothetical protein
MAFTLCGCFRGRTGPGIVAGALGLAGAAGLARADILTTNPVRDNTIFSNDASLSDGAGPTMYVGQTQGNGFRRAVMQFDLSSIPAGATVSSVSLTMKVIRTRGSGNYELHRVLASWGEGASNAGSPGGGGTPAMTGDATWNDRFLASGAWATPGGDFSPTVSGAAGIAGAGAVVWASAGMAADVQAWLANPSQNFGWLLRATVETAGANAKEFGSRENGTAGNRPSLTVVYTVPGPGAGACMMGALAGLAARRRRRS